MKESNKQFEQLNKPVNPFAWVDDCFCFFTDDDYSMLDDELKEGMMPLYTAPHHDSDVKQTKPLSDEEIDDYTKAYFNIHPEAKLSEQFKIKLYELQEFARAIEERHGIK